MIVVFFHVFRMKIFKLYTETFWSSKDQKNVQPYVYIWHV